MELFLQAADPIKIEVKKSSTPAYWYADLIGQEFIVESISIRDFFVYYGKTIKPILKIDADIK